ncbi:MAG TPA: hypothetical protein VK528_04775 [Flavobacterium sp.]|nr:hypothetical protein [Flavobacterium sp.]
MPLALKLRDEDNERINNVLKRLIGMDYVPGFGDEAIDGILAGIDLSLQKLLELNPNDTVSFLKARNFDWANAEQFADFLTILSVKLPEQQFGLREKAIAVYSYIQTESKTFSFDIFNKIASAKK